MGDVAQQVHVMQEARQPEFIELADLAYHICAQSTNLDEALEMADCLQVSRAHFTAARQEIHGHRAGLCPPHGHHGRTCAEYVASYREGHGNI